MVLDRQEFTEHFKSLDVRLAGPDSPLWIPDEATPSEWFVCIKPIGVHKFKSEYYDWCNDTLKGRVRCYSSDSEGQQEWWGFTDQEDIVLWTLKWI